MSDVFQRTLLLAAAAIALAPASAARAGTYEVLSCGAAGGTNNAWTPEVSSDSITATNACGSGGAFPADDVFIQFGGGLGVYTKLGAPAPPVGASGYWRFEVPDPLRITANRSTGHSHSESDSWRLLGETNFGELGHCQSNEPGSGITDFCDLAGGSYGTPLPATAIPYTQPARWVRFGFRCTIAPCDTGTSAHAAGSVTFADAMTVSDPVAPSVLLSGMPAQVTTPGPISATVSGSDQTGVSRLELLVDGQLVASSARTCDFTRVLPCEAPGGQVAATLASGGLSAGTHQITARAYDAAGNVASTGAQPVQASPPSGQPGPTTPGGTTPPTTPGGDPGPPPPTTPPSGPQALKLRIASVSRSGSRVRVRGTVAAGCRSRLALKVTAAGRTRSAKITAGRSGRWGVWVSGVRRNAKLRVKVSAKPTSGCTAGSASTSRR